MRPWPVFLQHLVPPERPPWRFGLPSLAQNAQKGKKLSANLAKVLQKSEFANGRSKPCLFLQPWPQHSSLSIHLLWPTSFLHIKCSNSFESMNCATLRDRYEIVQVNAACCCLWRQLLQTMCWNLRLSESVRGAGKTGRRNRAILWCLIAVTNPLSSNFPSCRSGLSHITAFTMLCPRIPICDVQTCIPYPQIAMSIGKLLINHQNYSKLGQLGDIGIVPTQFSNI